MICDICKLKSLNVKSVPVFQIKGELVYGKYCYDCLESSTDGKMSFGDFKYWDEEIGHWCLVWQPYQ